MTARDVILYIDFKSPFSYLAKDPARSLAEAFDLNLDWRPYPFDIPQWFGDPEKRTEAEWRKVRYAYMDVRRWANKRGLIIYGPKKAFDSSLAAIGMLYAQRQSVFPAYADMVFERFFKRALDIEDREAMRAVLAEAGADASGFDAFADGEGRNELVQIIAQAEEQGLFGVPTFIVDGELFWGYDRIDFLRLRLEEISTTY